MKFKAQIQNSELVKWKTAKVNQLLRVEFAKIGRWWHRVARPRHFTRGAFQRYPEYTPRSRAYNRRKKRKLGHTRPLVMSGETLRNSAQHNIRATSKGVTVTYPGLRKLNRDSRKSKVNKLREYQAVSTSEEKHMTTLMENSIERKLQTAARNGGSLVIRS